MLTNEQSLAATIEADKAAVTTARSVVQADEAWSRTRSSAELHRNPSADRRSHGQRPDPPGQRREGQRRRQPAGRHHAHPSDLRHLRRAEQFLDRIKRYRAAGELGVEAATTQGAAERTARGELSFINNTVDATTGTIQLKATFPNADNALWPGQFVNVVLTLTTEKGALVIPSRAIQPGQQGPFVFVVKHDQTVESRPVVVAFTEGADSVVAKGLSPGERVVTDGQLRLLPGVRAEIRSQGTAAPALPAPAATGKAGR
jgi:multidrug efflux pump subunit AcrA (membrane-fusion protein)